MNRKMYIIDRPIYTVESLKKDFHEETLSFNLKSSLKNKIRCKKQSFRSIFAVIFPLPFLLLSFYNLKFFLLDIIAGMTMVIFHIPQGLAYGLLSGLQPINGLYASFFPPLVYAFFGTSRHISIGTFSIMALLSSVPVYREAKFMVNNFTIDSLNSSTGNNSNTNYELDKLYISISTTLLAGILQIALGVFQFGSFMSYMSDAMIDGFTSAAAVHVIMSQMSNMLGYPIKAFSGIGELPYKTYLFFQNIKDTNIPTLLVSIFCIVILQIFSDFINPVFKKKFKFPLPIQFVLVILGTVISYFVDANGRFKIKIVGDIPKGLPDPLVPDVTYWPKIFTDAILLSIIGFVMNSSLVKIYSLKFCYDVNYNQEAIANGLANVVGSFFKCTMSAAALARTSVMVEVGMKSQVASLISCGLMLLILLFIGPLFTTVPRSVLSAIIVSSLTGMLIKVFSLRKLWYLSKFDFLVWLISYLSTLFLNVPYGLVIGFLFSLLTVLIRIQTPKSQILGQLPNTDLYKNVKLYKDAKELPGIKMFRYDAPLYFANAEHFQSKIYKKTGMNPHIIIKVKDKVDTNSSINCDIREDVENNESLVKKEKLMFIIIDCSSMNYIDNVGIRILEDIYKSYHNLGISVYLSSLNSGCRDMLQRANFAQENRERICFLSIHDAVLATNIYEPDLL